VHLDNDPGYTVIMKYVYMN